MALDKTNGEAAPAGDDRVPGSTAAGEFSPDFMAGVFARRGFKVPAALQAQIDESEKPDPKDKSAEENEETAADEAAAQAKAEGEAAETDKGELSDEEKAAAQAKAEPEAKKEPETAESKELAETVKVKLKDLPEAQKKIVQSILDERIGAISGRAKAETERLGARVTELNAELEAIRKQGGAPIVIPGVNPLMLVDNVEQLDAHADALEAHEDVLDLAKDTGFEADEAKGLPGYTAEQVRARLRAVRKERERLLPQARELLTKRIANAAATKAVYPELYNPTTEDFRLADQLRKQLPELRRLENADSFVAKFVLGAKALEAREKTPTKKAPLAGAPKGKTATQPPATTRKAPRAPGDGSAALGSVLDDQRRQQPDSSAAVSTFVKTRTRGDLLKAVGSLLMTG
jgi:hypothetical protein